MNALAKKLLSVGLLGISLLPSLSFAAPADNPFDIVQKTQNDATVDPVDSTPAPEVKTQVTPTSPSANTTATAVSADTATFGTALSKDRDIKAEAKLGVDEKARYEKVADFAGKFNDKLFGGGNGAGETGEKGAKNLLVTVARDAKNFFTILAFTFLIIVILVYFFGSK